MQSNLFVSCFITGLVYKRKLQKNGIKVSSYASSFNIFHENKDSDNCAKILEEECIKMFGTKYLNDEHDCNVVSMNSLNIYDANDMQSHKLGEAMFYEDDIFCPPSFDEKIYYDESMSTFVECIEFASTHQIGKIDFARGTSI